MSSEKENQPPTLQTRRRRSSMAELFTPNLTKENNAQPPNAMSSALSQAQQQARTRRLSITSVGLSGSSPTHTQPATPFGTLRDRGRSVTDGPPNGRNADESAIDEEADAVRPMAERGSPSSPAPRRVSFGNRRSTSGSAGTATDGKGSSPPLGRPKDGFNWSDSLRTRAERTSISAASAPAPVGLQMQAHSRSRSSVEEVTPVQRVAPSKAPDHFQERILKGDFYMD